MQTTNKENIVKPETQKKSKNFIPNSSAPFFKKNLDIGTINDGLETEADAIADQITNHSHASLPPSPPNNTNLQNKFNPISKELNKKPLSKQLSPSIQRKTTSNNQNKIASPGIVEKIKVSKGSGSLMDMATKESMENSFGEDFSEVRIHTNSNATHLNKSLNSQAFTVGNDIYFNEGRYNPNTTNGKHLLAHELTHTIQQAGSQQKIQRKIDLGVDEDAAMQDAIGDRAITQIGMPGRIGARIYGTEVVTKEYFGHKFSEEVEVDNYETIKTTGKKIYNLPGSSEVKYKLKYNEFVQVIGTTSDGWAVISSPKGYGWVQAQYVHFPTPDLKTELYFIKSGEYLKDVIANHYGSLGVNLNEWGKDTRLYVHAVALVNKDKKGIGYYESKEEISSFREILLDKTGEESQRIWNSAYLKKGHNIWMPSVEIINQMQQLGEISAGSVSYSVVETLLNSFLFNIGLQIGVFEGLWSAFVDTLSGIVDLVKLIGTLIEKIINGELLDFLTELWEGLVNSVIQLPQTLKKAWEDFMAKSAFDKGRAVGKVIGMILFEVLLIYFTAGAVSAVKWSGKAGKLASGFRNLPDIKIKKSKIKSKVDAPDAATKKKIEAHVNKKAEIQSVNKAEDLDMGTSSPEATKAVGQSLSKGAQQARDLNWPDPPEEGYFWVYRKSGKPYLSRTSKKSKKYFDEDSMTFKDGERPKAGTAHLPDVSDNYKFTTDTLSNGTIIKTAEGKLGTPGQVRKHRSTSSQRNISGGTGDDAGHLIGDRFGAPGTKKNLSRQNWKANQGGGTFHDLENTWDSLLQEGWEVEVKVSDLTKKGSDRPYTRKVEWSGKGPNGETIEVKNVEYVNFETKKSRNARGYVPDDKNGEVLILDDYR